MRAKKTKTEVRQEQIVKAALAMVAEEGLHALNIAGIAQRVGTAPSALYRHFSGKDEVLDGVLATIKKRLIANVAEVRSQTTDALQRLRLILMRHVQMLNETRAIPHVVFSGSIYTGYPERKARVADIITSYLEAIQEIVREGREQEVIRQEIEPKTVSVMFLGMILPAAVLWNVSEGIFNISEHTEKAWPLFVRSIAANENVYASR